MNINNNNYHELLLLYVDGELQPHEMDAVDDFVANNFEAKEELELLMQTKLEDIEPINFSGLQKDALFKFENDKINLHNYPAYFVEYVHNALKESEKLEVETFVAHNANLHAEFELYKQTKLLPNNALVFKNKEILYKKEEKRRILYMSFRQFSTAAVLIGIMVTTFIVFNKQEINNVAISPSTKEIATPQKSNETIAPALNIVENATAKTHINSNKTKTDVEPGKVVINSVASNNKIGIATIKQPANDKTSSTQPVLIIKNTSQQDNIAKTQEAIKPSNNIPTQETILPQNNVNSETVKNNVSENPEVDNKNATAKTVVFKNLDVDNENDNTVYVGNLKLNKQKVNGLLNKVGKIFGKSKKAQLEDVATSTASL